MVEYSARPASRTGPCPRLRTCRSSSSPIRRTPARHSHPYRAWRRPCAAKPAAPRARRARSCPCPHGKIASPLGSWRWLRAVPGTPVRADPVLRLLRAAPEAIGKSEPRGPARREKLRSAARNRPRPPPENATRRTPFKIRRFGMAKLASGTDAVNRAEALLARNAETPPSPARDQARQAPTACFE